MNPAATTGQSIPVSFPNKQGFRLFGILHRPERPRAGDPAILLLSPGVKGRVAPHRLYKKMAEQFVGLGYSVLRFDFHGLGDSEGEASEALLADLYGTIQVGRYVEDTIAAMDWLQQQYGISRFVASGLCGGAITGLLTAERDSRVVSLLALAIPAIVEGSRIDPSRYMTAGQLEGIRDGYLRKLTLRDAHAWRSLQRFLTFQTDYRLLLKSLIAPLKSRTGRVRTPTAAPAAPQTDDNTNPYFARAFFRMMSSSRRVFFVFAGADRLHWEFEAKFAGRHPENLRRFSDWHELHVIPQANHIFSLPEWQRELMHQCCRWLSDERHSTSTGVLPGRSTT